MLRILFSRLGQPRIGSPNANPFNVPSVKASGAITIERGAGKTKTERASFNRLGGMCPRCEGMGSVTDFDLSVLYDDSLSLNEGALTIPGYSMDGWYGRIYRGCGLFDPDKPISKYTKHELHDLLYKEPTKIKVEGINLTYEGLIPKIQKSMLSKDVVLPLTCSGTGALEAALANAVPPGGKAICLIAGRFGERWRNLCKAFGSRRSTSPSPTARPCSPEQLAGARRTSRRGRASARP